MSSMPPPPPPPPPGGFPPAPPPGYTPYMAAPALGEYASFGARLGAYLLDAIVGFIFVLPGYVVLLASKNGFGVVLVIAGAIAFLVMYCKKVAEGGSWGQKALGIRIVDATTGQNISAGRAFGRRLASLISAWICYLGFLWMLWDKDKQTWHDKIIGTKVVKL